MSAQMANQDNQSELHVIIGTGAVGKHTAHALAALGKRVRLVNRSGKASNLPIGAEVVRGNAYDAASIRTLTEDAAAVYQAAQPKYHEWQEKFPPLQTAILEGVAATGAKLIVIENLYMYGAPNGAPLREDSPLRAQTKKGKVRAAMSEVLQEAHAKGKVRVVIGRASNFFEPEYMLGGDLFFYPAIAGKRANLYGSLDVPHSFTYVPDFGQALALLGTRDEALGQVWHVPNAPAITQRELVRLTETALGKPVKVAVANRMIMRAFGLFDAGARETIEMMYEFEKPFIVDSSKFERTFGLHATPMPQAVTESVAWFKAHPQGAH